MKMQREWLERRCEDLDRVQRAVCALREQLYGLEGNMEDAADDAACPAVTLHECRLCLSPEHRDEIEGGVADFFGGLEGWSK